MREHRDSMYYSAQCNFFFFLSFVNLSRLTGFLADAARSHTMSTPCNLSICISTEIQCITWQNCSLFCIFREIVTVNRFSGRNSTYCFQLMCRIGCFMNVYLQFNDTFYCHLCVMKWGGYCGPRCSALLQQRASGSIVEILALSGG